MIEPSRMCCVVIRDRAYHALQDAVRRTGRLKGFLQADAYGGYDGIYTGSNSEIVEVGCMAHDNKFSEADSTDPERVLAAKACWVQTLRRRGRGQGHHRRGKADRTAAAVVRFTA